MAITQAEITAGVTAIVGWGASALVTKGLISADTVPLLTGAAAAIIAAGWAIWAFRTQGMVNQTSKLTTADGAQLVDAIHVNDSTVAANAPANVVKTPGT